MALVYMDSFDHYATADLLEKWSTTFNSGSIFILAAAGRRGSAALQFTNYDRAVYSRPLSGVSTPTAIVGFAFAISAIPVNALSILNITLGTAAQLRVYINTIGQLQVRRSSTILGTSSTSLTAGATNFTYIELKTTLHATTGSVVLRFNGVEVLNLTNVNTLEQGSGGWNGVMLGPAQKDSAATFNMYFDDLYVLDDAGAAPWNTFLGDCRVDARVATAAGTTTQFTPSAGSNWQNVDDAAPNDDTDYNSSTTVGHTDTFVVQDAPVAGAVIYGVQHCLSAKKSDAGTCLMAPIVRHSGTDYVGAEFAPSTSYVYGLHVQATNPGTSAQWIDTDFNNAEFGYKRTA